MESINITKTDHGYNYCIDRQTVTLNWAKKTFFDVPGVDAVGFRISHENYITTHHIYINNRTTCVGLIPITMSLHKYIDEYLLYKDFKEYERWNLYFKKVYDYIYSNDETIDVNDLIRERNILLERILTIKKNKNKRQYKYIYPYVMEIFNRVQDISKEEILNRAFRKSKENRKIKTYPFSFLVFDKLLNNKINSQQIDSHDAIKNYLFSLSYNDTFNIHDIISRRYESITKVKEQKLDIHSGVDKYLKEHHELLRCDWMKNIIPNKGTISDQYLLTEQSKNVLLYLHDMNPYLFDLWEQVLNRCKNEDAIDEELLMIIDVLRRITFEFINEEISKSKDGDLLHKIDVLKKDLHCNPEKLSAFDDPDINHNLCFKAVNEYVYWDEYHRVKKVCEEIKNKYTYSANGDTTEFDIQINASNLKIKDKFNNDFMGNSFITFDDNEDHSQYFISHTSLELLKILKDKEPALHNKWKSFFAFLKIENKKLKSNDEYKKLVLLKVHFQIKKLREASVPVIMATTQNNKDIIDMLTNEHIRLYLPNIATIYDSVEVERMITTDFGYTAYDKALYDKRVSEIFDGQTKQKIQLKNKSRVKRLISKKTNKDWMGFDLDLQYLEECTLDEDITDNLFLTDESKEILQFIKNKKQKLYTKIMDLLNKIPIDNPNNRPFGYEVNMDNLLYEVYCIMNGYRRQFNEAQENAFVRLRNTIYK